MSYFDLNNDFKTIIAKTFSNDMNINKMFMSKHGDFQNYYLEKLHLTKNIIQSNKSSRISDDDDFNMGNIHILLATNGQS